MFSEGVKQSLNNGGGEDENGISYLEFLADL